MIKIKALRTFRSGSVNIRRDSFAQVTDAAGKELIARGLAAEVKAPAAKKAEEPKPAKADAKKAD